MQVARGTTLAVAGLLTAAAVTATVVARRRPDDAGDVVVPPAVTPAPTIAPITAPTQEPSPGPAAERRAAKEPAPASPSIPVSSDPPVENGDSPPVPAGPVIDRVAGAGRRVALTFDDGPAAATDAILGALDQHDVRATFFVVGRQAAADGARLARMHDAGHVIANHSWDHSDLTALDSEQVRRQLADTSAAIEQATGRAPDIFRPPYGARTEHVDEVARQLGMRDITWDVDTRDWTRPGTEAIVRSAVDGARDGSIILLHDGGGNREQTVAAIGPIVTGLRERGFEIVTVPELVAARG